MSNKKVSLAEVMGSGPANQVQGGLKLSNIHQILGDATPELPFNSVGRHRLVRALQQRFGPNFRSLPGIKGLIKEFDDNLAFEDKIRSMKSIKLGGRRG